jgi:hypothetical protein
MDPAPPRSEAEWRAENAELRTLVERMLQLIAGEMSSGLHLDLHRRGPDRLPLQR